MYERDHLKKQAVRFKDDHLWVKYKNVRNKINNLLKVSKKDYAMHKINESRGNSKKTWKVLHELTSSNKKKSAYPNVDAQEFNEFFSSIGVNTVATIDVAPENFYWRSQACLYNFTFEHTNYDVVLKHLLKLGNDSSMDVLGFDKKLLSCAGEVIAPIICKFIDVSLHSKIVLEDWKMSRVTPIYKGKGDMEDLTNYRPISVISHIAKIVEKIVQSQIMNYLESHELITADQSAYLKKHNTQTSLHRVVDDWLSNIDDGLLTGMCSLDIKKCFDTINHEILLKKMKMYGFTSDVLQWFYCYLSNRGSIVYANGECSDVRYINIGVPQGSVLGPTLFLIYINDINNYLGSAVCNLYADDVLIYCSGEDVKGLNDNLQSSLNCVKQWYDNNLLVVNASKSNSMLITTRQKEMFLDCDMELFLGDAKLEHVDCCNYLGLYIDKNLNWGDYVDSLSKQLSKKVWMLSRLRCFLPHQSLVQLYKSYIQPKIDYAITVWGYSSDTNICKIQRMQNRAARAIYGIYDYVNVRGIDLLTDMNVMNVKQRRDYFMALLVFKSIYGLAPEYLCNEITMKIEVSQRLTRHVNENDVFVPDVNKEIAKSSFLYQGPTIWNQLPDYIKRCTDVEKFKNLVKKHYLGKLQC